MENTNDPDVSSDFPIPTIFDRSKFPNQQRNLPYTSTGTYNHYDQALNFQAHATNDGYQVTEQPMRPQAVYCQPQSCQVQVPNDGYQVAEQPMSSQTVYGLPLGFQAPVENRGYEVSSNRAQLEVEPPQEMDKEIYFISLIKETAKVHKEIVNKKDKELVAQQTASKAQLESATAEIIRLQNVERRKTGEFEQLNEKMNELDTGFKRALNENQNLKEQLVQLGLEKQLLNETLHEKASEIQTMTEQLSEKNRQLEESNVHAAALNGTLAEKEVEINQLNAQNSSLRGELAAEKEENQNLKSELAKKKKIATKTIQQNFLMVSSTITDAAQKTVRNGEQNKSVKRRIPTINIESGAETFANDGREQEEVHSSRKIGSESFKRKRNVKIHMCSSTTTYCDADESSNNKNGPSQT